MSTIKQYLERENISQAQLADALGISQTFLSLILSGARRPGFALTKRIEVVTGIPRHVLRPDVYEAAQ